MAFPSPVHSNLQSSCWSSGSSAWLVPVAPCRATKRANFQPQRSFGGFKRHEPRKGKNPPASGVRKVVPKNLEESPPLSHRVVFRERSRREGMGERICPSREERGRSPKGAGAVSVRKEGPGLGAWARQRQEEFLKWKAEEEDRENLAKARRVSLQPDDQLRTLLAQALSNNLLS